MSGNGFVRRDADGVPYYSCVALERLAQVRHGFSTRIGGVAAAQGGSLNLSLVSWDTPERVAENRRRFLSSLGLASARLATLSQIHSDRLHIIEDTPDQWNRRREGDALATSLAGVAVGVLVADCFPILIADPDSGAVAAIHSGWRGTAQRILSKTIERMRAAFGSTPSRLLAAVGAGIRSCCFEVGAEVATLFEESYPGANLGRPLAGRTAKYLLDLPRALAIQCAEAGLAPEHVFDLGACTCCSPQEFFSYRAEGQNAGRLMAVIARIS
jgi:YfiH family protein